MPQPVQLPVRQVIEALKADERIGGQLAAVVYLPPARETFGELDPPLAAPLAGALDSLGVGRLWSHQARGLSAVRGGEDLLVTTPTASGKSLIFQLPVLEEALAGGPRRALFLYPLKALGQDQRAKLNRLAELAGLGGGEFAGIYDGDASRSERQRMKRELPRVVISNPDMLHLGVLGYWQSWEKLLGELGWIVLDELHTYRGIFGSHFHHVLRRLLRVCGHLGSRPRIVASSATAANADEFAEVLAGRRFRWLTESGAPREGRHLLLVRPEASPYSAALDITARLLDAGLKTIVFTKARRITELLFSWLKQQRPDLASRVASYRSGFLATERRRIERRLFDGELDGVISTSALEMGIDVGGLDACVLVGYPGSVMATWQRSGRVGRADRESVTAMVALPDALDQYYLDHPRQFVERPCEQLLLDPANEPVSRAHLVCAAAELPLRRSADRGYLEAHAPLVGELLRGGELHESADGEQLHSRRRRPQREVNIRGGATTATILRTDDGRVIGTVDGVRMMHECHPGAVYLHFGRQYLVRELDLEAGKVHAEPARLDYFTNPRTDKETEILEVLDQREDGPLQAWLGRLRVTERVIGFERRKIRSRELLDQQDLDLPPARFETVGLWWAAPEPLEESLRQRGEGFMGALHATEHATISLFPTFVICDRGDIGGISLPRHPQLGCGSVFIYDGHPGGVGIAARGFRDLPDLLGRVLDLLGGCRCDEGCPSCVQSPKCGNGNRPLDKAGAVRLLRLLLGRERPVNGDRTAAVTVRPLDPEVAAAAPAGGERPSLAGSPHESVQPAREAAAAAAGSDGGMSAPGALPPPSAPQGPVPATPAAARPSPREPPPPKRSHHTVLFDLETIRGSAELGGWHKIYQMRVATGAVLQLQEGRMESFGEDGVGELIARLEAADLVVGFNVKRFDYEVLSAYTGIDYRRKLPTLDLWEEVRRQLGFRLGLNHLVDATLGAHKTADGLQSLEWVKQGRMDLVEAYCRHDVELLRDLYLFGRRMGYVLYRDKAKNTLKLPVEW
jgi:DEAD/DEAH box helicase domain-containing protein